MYSAKAKRAAPWVALCIACTAAFEGLRTSAYFDVGGVPTACFGETAGIKIGDKFTAEQCREMLSNRIVEDFGPAVDRCVGHELPPHRKASYTSLTYNIGVGAFCGSSVVRHEKAGNVQAACDAMLLWNKVRIAGVLVYSPGLNNRRVEERKLCLSA